MTRNYLLAATTLALVASYALRNFRMTPETSFFYRALQMNLIFGAVKYKLLPLLSQRPKMQVMVGLFLAAVTNFGACSGSKSPVFILVSSVAMTLPIVYSAQLGKALQDPRAFVKKVQLRGLDEALGAVDRKYASLSP